MSFFIPLNVTQVKAAWMIGAAFALLPSLAEAGTVAYYRFENANPTAAVDETGNHNGTITPGSFSSSVGQNPVAQTGAPNTQSLSISGGQYASIPHSSSLSFGNNPWTIEAYINLNALPTASTAGQYIVQKKGAQVDDFQDYAFFIAGNRTNLANTYGNTGVDNTGAELRVEFGLGVAPGIVGVTSNLVVPSAGGWVFVSAAYDGGTSLRFTLDTNLSDSLPGLIDTIALPGLSTVTNTGPLNIGAKLSGAGAPAQPFGGLLDEVRISNEVLGTSALLNVPEPSTWALATLSVLAMGLVARRRRKA